MKTFLTRVALFAGSAFPAVALAQGPPTAVPTPVASIGDFYGMACTAMNWIFSFLIIVAVITILLAALSFLTSGGQEDKIATARRFLIYALVGVAVAILARSLVNVTGSFIGADVGGFFDC